MAYKMEYGMHAPVVSTTKTVRKKGRVSPRNWIVFGLLIGILVLCGTTDILIPGDAEVTKAAMSDFVSDIKGGEQVVDAFAAFCQTVLQSS